MIKKIKRIRKRRKIRKKPVVKRELPKEIPPAFIINNIPTNVPQVRL